MRIYQSDAMERFFWFEPVGSAFVVDYGYSALLPRIESYRVIADPHEDSDAISSQGGCA